MKILISIFPLVFLSIPTVFGQGDSLRFKHGLPVREDDTVSDFPKQDFYPKNKYTRVPLSQIPSGIRSELNSDRLYKGWKEFPVYRDNNTQLYIIRTREGNSIRTYGFDKKGNPVTFNISTQQQ